MATGTTQQAPDRIDSVKSLESSVMDQEPNPISVENFTEQPPSAKDEKISSNVPHDSNTLDLSRDAPGQLGSVNADGNKTAVYVSNMYSPQTQTVFYGGYDNQIGEWEEYTTRYLNVEGLEVGSTGFYNENPSLIYPTGYGYSSQMPYGSYSPVTTPLPSVNGDGQLFSPQQFPFSGTYYQQPAPPSMPYLTSPAPISQADLTISVDQQGAFLADTSNSHGMPFGPKPGFQLSYGSSGRDWLKSPDGAGSNTPLLPSASPQPMGGLMSFGQRNVHLASGMIQASPQQRSLYSFGSSINSYDRGYPHSGLFHGSTFGTSFPSFGVNGRSLVSVENSRRRGKGNASLCSCNGTLDFLIEQNRGPRANRSKNQMAEQNSSLDNGNDNSTAGVDHKLYKSLDFLTEYKDAKFFIIKSYTEDNVHKSIKYGVWASTSNGNKKLNSAYHEAKEKEDPCPVFLFFSVNASAQFCGVAEMIGPVDFEKSVDYWQQDKWSGQFPVKWHIMKDVPNNLFRHIILEDNDNKPVTNSRDTQEVKLEQGLEILSIFKKHECESSILDDFEFYEKREKAMQERKVRQQQLSNLTMTVPAAAGSEKRNLATFSGDYISQMSKSFAQVVRLEEKAHSSLINSSSVSTDTAAKPEDVRKNSNCDKEQLAGKPSIGN